jgi:hypothetical protein
MRPSSVWTGTVVLLVTSALACGSSGSDTGGSKSSVSAGDAGTDAACSPPGTKGNALGIGAYCNAKTKCTGDTFCTADFGTEEGSSFCSRQCAKDSECGEGAFCYKEARGAGCVTRACAPQ